MPGPPPKRAEERRRANQPAAGDPRQLDVSALPDDHPVKAEMPLPAADESWHPIAKEMWGAFHASGSALLWEPSDWIAAKLLCESLSRDLGEQVVGITESGEVVRAEIPLKGASLNAYAKLMGMLMLTEADRRRAGFEIKRDRWGANRVALAPVTPIAQRQREALGG